MSKRIVWGLLFSVGLLSACHSPDEVTVDQVFAFRDCPEGFVCEKFADGSSRVTVEACVDKGIEVRADQQLTLTLSAGTWEGQDASARSISKSIQADPCVRPTFVTSADVTRIRVDAELLGFRRTLDITLQPARIAVVEVTSTPLPVKAGHLSQIELSAKTGSSGVPTRGTSAVVVATVEPSTAQVGVWPKQVSLDTNGNATVQLLTSVDATRVELKAQVLPPGAGAGAAPLKEETVVFPVAPPPAEG